MHVLGDWYILLLETKINITYFNKIFFFNKSGWLVYFNNPNGIRCKNTLSCIHIYMSGYYNCQVPGNQQLSPLETGDEN